VERLAELITGEERALAVGSKTSKSPCFRADQLEIGLDHFNQLEVDQEQQVARVGAGVQLSALLNALREHRLALPTIGEWSGQTLGGAISTGTHGGSYIYGSLVSSVRAVTFIDGHGELREVRREDPDFRHMIPSFGATGVVISYELECEPSFTVSLTRRTVHFSEYLERLLTLVDAESPPDFKSSIWLPALDYVVDYEGVRAEDEAVIRAEASRPLRDERETRFNSPAVVLDWLSKQVARGGRDVLGETWRGRRGLSISRAAAHLLGPRDYLGDYDAMIAPLRGDPEKILEKRARNKTPPEGEFAVSYEAAGPLINRLRDLFTQEGWYPDRPVGLRPGAAESASLVAAQGEPCVWVSLFIYPQNPLMRVLPELLMEHRARPHWGKCVFHPLDRIHELYPDWAAFKQRRDELDPRRVFINDFASSLGL
jgi:hypothetical protein